MLVTTANLAYLSVTKRVPFSPSPPIPENNNRYFDRSDNRQARKRKQLLHERRTLTRRGFRSTRGRAPTLENTNLCEAWIDLSPRILRQLLATAITGVQLTAGFFAYRSNNPLFRGDIPS